MSRRPLTRQEFVDRERDVQADFFLTGPTELSYTCEACGHVERGGRAAGLIWDHVMSHSQAAGGGK